MSEWKMNRMISSFWGKLEERRDQRKLIKYKNWCALVEKKCASTLTVLKALEGADMDKKEKLTMTTNKVIVGVNELIALLSMNAFKNGTSIMNANASLQDSIRTALLEVWPALLSSMAKLEFIDVTVVTQVHKAVLLLMCRDEFDCDALTASYSSAALREGAVGNRDILSKYRSMLLTTLNAASQRLLEKTPAAGNNLTFNGPLNSMMNINFMSKVLAILYWRLPNVGTSISQILEIPNMELLAPVLSFPAFPDDHCITTSSTYLPNDPKNNNTSTNNNNINNTNNNTNNINKINNNPPINNPPANKIQTTNPSTQTTNPEPTQDTTQTNTPVPISTGAKSSSHTLLPPPPRNKQASLFGWAALYKDLPPLNDPSASISPMLLLASSTPTPTPTPTPQAIPARSLISAPTLTAIQVPLAALPPTTWLGVVAKFDTTYVTFFKEWILHVKSVLGKVEWSHVPGFPRLLQSLLYQMRTKEQPPPPLSKPYPLLELQYLLLEQTNAELIDAFVKAAFLRTNVFDLLSVLNTLHLLEGWFCELQAHDFMLPSTFDMRFYCSGVDILLKTDHHQIVLRVITLIYTFSELFENEHRVYLFDLLLSKYFYTLFMHWDPGVRNAYHQLLIFKMVRIKRSKLYHQGYIVKELSQVGLTSYHMQVGENHVSNGFSSSPSSSSPNSSFLNNRSGSGFFSTFSNVLPAFFSLSNSPDKNPNNPVDGQNLSSAHTELNHNGEHDLLAKQGNHNLEDGFVEVSKNDTKHDQEHSTENASTHPPATPKTTNSSVNSTPTNSTPTPATPSPTSTPSTTTPTTPSTSPSSSSSTPHTAPVSPPVPRAATVPPTQTPSTQTPSPSTQTPSPSTQTPSPSTQTPPATPDTTPTSSTAPVTAKPAPSPAQAKATREIDVQLFLKLNSYLKTIEDQLRKPTAPKIFEAHLEPYAPYALAEFNQHLARYHQWELKNEDTPQFMSLPFARMGEG